MGCYPPLGKLVSKVLGKCNGRERWREGRLDFDYALAYPPGPPTEVHYVRPVARTVTFASNNSVYVIPPSPPPQPQPQQQSTPEPQQQPQAQPGHDEPEQHQDTPESQPPPQTEQQPESETPAQTQDAAPQAEPKPPKGPKRGKKKQPGRVRFGPEPPPQQQEEQEQAQQEQHAQGPPSNSENAPGQQGPQGASPAPAPAPTPGYLLRYTPSPLPRWEATPRRHEYFSGEYRSYYPTPVREGIYRIATDANRLTTIFSEENPNACTIV